MNDNKFEIVRAHTTVSTRRQEIINQLKRARSMKTPPYVTLLSEDISISSTAFAAVRELVIADLEARLAEVECCVSRTA